MDGKWSGSIDTPNGPAQLSYVFKANRTKLTGSSMGLDGTSIPLKIGKIDGNKVSFSLELNFGADPTTFEYRGVVMGKEMKLHSEFMG